MSLRINHNIASLNGHRSMLRNDSAISKSLEKLSSGLRINRAADDAAGLVISEQMRAQISGLGQAVKNSETAVSMVQTAEGALDEMNTLLNKARTLALHAANEGANDQNQLVADQSELDNIIDSVDRIAGQTQFGTKRILDGSLSTASSNHSAISSVKLGGHYATDLVEGNVVKGYHSLEITQAATRANVVINGTLGTGVLSGGSLEDAGASDQFLKGFTFSIMGANVSVVSGSTKKNLVDNLNAVGRSLGFTAQISGTVGTMSGNVVLVAKDVGGQVAFDYAFVSGFSGATAMVATETSGVDYTANLILNTGVVGGVADSGGAQVVALTGNGLTLKLSGYRVTLAYGVETVSGGYFAGAINGNSSGATFQIGANVGQRATVALDSMKASEIGVGRSGVFNSLAQLKGGSLTTGQSDEVLKVIDGAIDEITTTRGRLGAFQANTLESGLNSLRTTQENLTAAESSIRDVDFAEESAMFTRNNILIQASTAMLAQANQLPQNVLQLLG